MKRRKEMEGEELTQEMQAELYICSTPQLQQGNYCTAMQGRSVCAELRQTDYYRTALKVFL